MSKRSYPSDNNENDFDFARYEFGDIADSDDEFDNLDDDVNLDQLPAGVNDVGWEFLQRERFDEGYYRR